MKKWSQFKVNKKKKIHSKHDVSRWHRDGISNSYHEIIYGNGRRVLKVFVSSSANIINVFELKIINYVVL